MIRDVTNIHFFREFITAKTIKAFLRYHQPPHQPPHLLHFYHLKREKIVRQEISCETNLIVV